MNYLVCDKKKIIDKMIANGVIINDLDGLIIDETSVIEQGVVLEGNNRIKAAHICEGAIIKSGNVIENSYIGALCVIEKSIVRDSRIDSNTSVTMAHVHSASAVGRDCRVGNFVEIKNSHIGKANKIAHLAYVGDVDMGDYCNVGCGAIFVNYDGKNKHRSIVGDSVFIGSNCNIIAPVKLENRAYIAAGTTVTKDLPGGCMCIGRDRETIKENRSKYGNVKNRLFGTDGIRGVYGDFVTEDMAYLAGNFLGYSSDGGLVVVARDTRTSGKSLEDALIKGIVDAGSDVVRIGIATTPIVAYSLKELGANYGVMLTASHNPPEYNGIKIFNSDCGKLGELEEAEIERHIFGGKSIIRASVGKVSDGSYLKQRYSGDVFNRVGIKPCGNKHIKVVFDVANGSAADTVRLFTDLLDMDVIIICDSTNGLHINENCGATSIGKLQECVLANHADIGLAFDGDADRLIAVDEKGGVLDGDAILYILADYFRHNSANAISTVACTVLSNMGFIRALEKIGVNARITDVGDHNVAVCMKDNRLTLGGEQSGHIIFGNFLMTGDGLYAGAMMLKILSESDKKLSELNKVEKYPQVFKNIRIKEKVTVDDYLIKEQVKEINDYYDGKARLLVRKSGTEPVIRIMAEASTQELAEHIAELAAANIEKIDNRSNK